MKKLRLSQTDNILGWTIYGFFSLGFGYYVVSLFTLFLWYSVKDICKSSLQPEQYKMFLELHPYVELFNILGGLVIALLMICIKLIYYRVKKPKAEESVSQN